MRCLVTGVAGFVGSHLAERLLLDGHEVLGVDSFTDYYPRTFKEANVEAIRDQGRFQLVEGDLAVVPLAPLLDGVDWIFHQAAQAGVRASWGQTFGIYTACNITATQRLLESVLHAPALKRFVYASSSSVYGDADALPITEHTLTRPVSPYGVSKLSAEHLCALYWKNFQVPTVSLRYFTVYGPRQRPDMAFHRFGQALLTGAPVLVYGDASQTRDFTYVSDVVDANIRAAQAPDVTGRVFNIAGGSRVVLREVIATMAEMLGRPANIVYQENARGDVRDTCGDIRLASHLLGYAPKVPFSDGLARELDYLTRWYAHEQPAGIWPS
jgi:nucleoside-diphosphate-sugar epimerase